ncbi:DUF1028 domain-containing protein [Microbacterium sp. CPCC 204701]|uniref:DUF1028 domain-containing protein n=1 Tax=Microbacterium sp. CPCC 204701 TaxID=2493084 RepID=UPI000FD9BC7F|nr:DUF1028 domain-containing protein [Microbacterium sp. CPCC 204701]
MTYSIIARDPESGAFGLACETHFFGVGRLVGWLEPGVGAVATQAFVNVGLGPRGLALLRDGVAADDAVRALISDDDQPGFRQVAAIDANGVVGNFTGDKCVRSAGALTGDQVSVQGNMLANDDVVPAILAAYQRAAGEPFARRLLIALRAGEDAGGDARGSQSAVLKIVSGRRGPLWEETSLDLRVDDHPDPVTEITRLAELSGAFDRIGSVMFAPRIMIGDYVDVTDAELAAAVAALDAAQDVLGDNLEAAFWNGVLLARAGRDGEARERLAAVFEAQSHWRSYLDAVADAGFLDRAKVPALVKG